MSPAFRVSYSELRVLKYSYFMIGQYFNIQEKEYDTQEEIDQDKPRLGEQTLLMMESTPSRDNRDIILDVTLFAENLAEVSN